MKILQCLVMIALFAACAFAQNGDIDGGQKAFNDCVNILDNLFDQNSSRTGEDGIKIKCILMPQGEMTAVAWEIVNPNGKLLTIGSGDISLSGQDGPYQMIDTEEAINLFYRGENELDAANDTAEAFVQDQNEPGEDMQESTFYGSEFKYGETDSGVIRGITYFAISLKDVKSVTAEIKVSGELYKFTFDGGGP